MFFNILELIKNNKLIILFLVAICVFLYYFINKKEGMKNQKQVKPKNFIQSDKFNGAKKGYVFKMDKQGLGYYIDN